MNVFLLLSLGVVYVSGADWTSMLSSLLAESLKDFSKVGTFSSRPSAGDYALKYYPGVTRHSSTATSYPTAYRDAFNDPHWIKQWYLQDYRMVEGPVMDMNVVPAHRGGVTGQGVKVGVVDVHFDTNHDDIAPNFLPQYSYDVCNGRQELPPPNPSSGLKSSPGLLAAGVIAMAANNSLCGVGVAYNAKVAAILTGCSRMDTVKEAESLRTSLDNLDIYASAWAANGVLHKRIKAAIYQGISRGRGGKGAIYVFPSSSSLPMQHCAMNPYLNHRGTIGISSVSQHGKPTSVDTRCASVLAAAYTGDWHTEKMVSTDLGNTCNTKFFGAPSSMAAGIIALALEANSELTYRDVMHLITMSAEVAPLADNPDSWRRNGAGFWVSHDFGFGLLNAENMVLLARNWKPVPKESTCMFSVFLDEEVEMTVGYTVELEFHTDGCQSTVDAVQVLEQLQVAFNIAYPYRGAVTLQITSPRGTKTTLLEERPSDRDASPFVGQTVRSVHNWGEDPRGKWKMQALLKYAPAGGPAKGLLSGFTVTLRGTAKPPPHHAQLPRTYAGFRLADGQTSQDVHN